MTVDLRNDQTQYAQGSKDGQLLVHAEDIDEGSIWVVRVFRRGQLVIQGYRTWVVFNHLGDGNEDGLDRVYPLELPDEVDV